MSRKLTVVLAMSGLISAGAAGVSNAAETELPVYAVKSSGLDERQTAALQRAFGLKDVDRSEYGAVAFADEAKHLNVPSIDKGEGRPDEDGNATTQTAIDLEGLKKLRAIPADEAVKRTQESLRGAGLLPANAKPTSGQTTFEVVDANGWPTLTAPLDTSVSYSFSLDGIPLEGAGAKLRVAFDGSGQVTSLSHSTRTVAKSGSVPVHDLATGRERCAKAFGEGVKLDGVSYVYVAPPLEEKVGELVPSFRCDGSVPDGSKAQAITVPAVVGATLPAPDPGQEPRHEGLSLQAANPIEVGSEGTGQCSGLPNTHANIGSFNSEFTGHGVPVQFSWLSQNAWESDFKDPVFPGGQDHNYADDVDLTYWQGHGSPTGFYFTGCSNHNDTKLANTEARWGNKDVEWMSLFTCQILQKTSGGQSWAQRWGQAFRGLHQINSFDTVSYNSSNHGEKFGHYMLRNPFLWWNKPMKVRDAWAQASIDTQPASVVWATMGPIANGGLANFNDYFWGKGAVGADVLPSGGYWRISGNS